MVTPAARREAVAILVELHEMSERRACSVIGADRASVRYRSRRPDDAGLRERMRTLAGEPRRFGYPLAGRRLPAIAVRRRLHVLLRREGLVMNRKKTQRLYREEGLSVRKRRGRKKATGTRAPLLTVAVPNARPRSAIAMQSPAGQRVGRFRARPVRAGSPVHLPLGSDQWRHNGAFFNVIDDVTKECLAAVVDTSISGRRVARELSAVIARRGKPGLIVSDHGTEFTSNAMLAWTEEAGVSWHFIAPGKPPLAHAGMRCRAADAERDLRSLQFEDAGRAIERDAVSRA